jgi:hypothetical protein
VKENEMNSMTSNLIRWAGLAAAAGGSLFVGIQVIHPPDTLASVTTPAWATVHFLGVAMSVFVLLGLTGIYARQARAAGVLGLTGYLLFGAFWATAGAFQFAEALILPAVAADAPAFVDGWMGMIDESGRGRELLGALPLVHTVSGLLYLLGGLVFGVATIRAGVLVRWAGGLIAGAAIAAPVLSVLLPHEFVRGAAAPMGLALAWLGYALWSERRQDAAAPASGVPHLRLGQAGAE